MVSDSVCAFPASSKEVYDLHASTFINVIEALHEDVVCFFMGDFNLPSTTWINTIDSDYDFLVPLSSTERDDGFLSSLAMNGFFQINGFHNLNGRLLDLIFSNQTIDIEVSRVREQRSVT